MPYSWPNGRDVQERFSVAAERVTGISNAFMGGATGSHYLGSVIDNADFRDRFLTLDVKVTCAYYETPANAHVELHLLYSSDGVDFNTHLTKQAPLATFITNYLDEDESQREIFTDLPIAPFKFKILVRNQTGEEIRATVRAFTYRTLAGR